MMGRRPARQGELFCYLPEVPRTKLAARLEELERALDWEQVRCRAQAYLAGDRGRPSLDPAVVVKLLLLHKLVGGRSWRGLVEFASDSLCSRQFLGYGLSEDLPSHQALHDWRRRLGAEFFEDLLGDIVGHCQREGMVLSSVRVVDATAVKAQADPEGPTVRVEADADELAVWQAVVGCHGANEGDDDDDPSPEPPPTLLSRPPALRDGSAKGGAKGGGAKGGRLVSRHDPEARLSAKPGLPRDFYYQVSFASDPVSGLITSAMARPTEEPVTLLAHVDAEPGLVAAVVADCHYDTTEVMAGLAQRGITAYIPYQDHQRQHGYRREQFGHSAELDCYQCPEGVLLTRRATMSDGRVTYRARVGACRDCRRRSWCTSSECRTLTVPAGSAERELARRAGPEYELRQAQRRAQEHVWRWGKRDFGLSRADGLGLAQVRISAALVAVCINLGKLVKWRETGPRPEAVARAQEATGRRIEASPRRWPGRRRAA
ncbi:MAG: transposase [Armatimonadetes bacterium]|nr:transposase [Armatimonadota bacterium]